jgi:hypothetical protein
LINYTNVYIAVHAVLTGKPRVRAKVAFGRKYALLRRPHRAPFALDHLDAARRAAGIPAAAVKNVDTIVFKAVNQLQAFIACERDRPRRGFGGYFRHLSESPFYLFSAKTMFSICHTGMRFARPAQLPSGLMRPIPYVSFTGIQARPPAISISIINDRKVEVEAQGVRPHCLVRDGRLPALDRGDLV